MLHRWQVLRKRWWVNIFSKKRRKNYNESLKDKKQIKHFPQDSKMFSKEKKKYGDMTKMNENSEDNNEICDNMIMNDNTKGKSKDDEMKKNKDQIQ